MPIKYTRVCDRGDMRSVDDKRGVLGGDYYALATDGSNDKPGKPYLQRYYEGKIVQLRPMRPGKTRIDSLSHEERLAIRHRRGQYRANT